jgi:hypothetical protein
VAENNAFDSFAGQMIEPNICQQKDAILIHLHIELMSLCGILILVQSLQHKKSKNICGLCCWGKCKKVSSAISAIILCSVNIYLATCWIGMECFKTDKTGGIISNSLKRTFTLAKVSHTYLGHTIYLRPLC